MSTPITHLLYLHGFRSSPQSTKARQMAAWMQAQHPQVQWWCPQLPPSPAEAAQRIAQGTRDWPSASMGVVGSSLGGFYATWLAQQRVADAALTSADMASPRAVLINPAVTPERSLAQHLGEHSAWHDPQTRFAFTRAHLDELRALQTGPLQQPERFLAIIAKGDEVLDWREMLARYQSAPHVLLEGGDHALTEFEPHWARIQAFFGLKVG